MGSANQISSDRKELSISACPNALGADIDIDGIDGIAAKAHLNTVLSRSNHSERKELSQEWNVVQGRVRKPAKSRSKRWDHPGGLPMSSIVPGSHVEGTVTNIKRNRVFIDIGAVRDGVLLLGSEKCPFKRHDLVKGLQVVSVDSRRGQVELALGPIELEVLLISGMRLATLSAYSSWTGADVKFALRSFLQRGHVVSNLVSDNQDFQNSMTINDLGIMSGSVLVAVVRACDYLVEDAGKSEVNGHYQQTGELMNGAPSYTNEAGVVLFRYVFPNGVAYWYFSKLGENVQKKFGDFYRMKTEEMRPPVGPGNWSIHNLVTGKIECPLGDCVFPVVSRICAAEDDDMVNQAMVNDEEAVVLKPQLGAAIDIAIV